MEKTLDTYRETIHCEVICASQGNKMSTTPPLKKSRATTHTRRTERRLEEAEKENIHEAKQCRPTVPTIFCLLCQVCSKTWYLYSSMRLDCNTRSIRQGHWRFTIHWGYENPQETTEVFERGPLFKRTLYKHIQQWLSLYPSVIRGWWAKVYSTQFSKSDRTFDTHEVLTSAQIEDLRSGNQQAVRTTNISRRIKHGATLQTCSPAMMANVSNVHGFMNNCVYSPVH